MLRFLPHAFVLVASAALPAQAQEAVVTLPTIPVLPDGEARHLLNILVHANIAAVNCDGVADTASPLLLLWGAMDLVSDQLAMDERAMDTLRAPVLAALAKPGFCATEAARFGLVMDMLVFWGGSLTLIRD